MPDATTLADKLGNYSPSCFDLTYFIVEDLRDKLGGDLTLDEVIEALGDFLSGDLPLDGWIADHRPRYAMAWSAFHDEPLIAGEMMAGLRSDDDAANDEYNASPQVEWVERELVA